MLAWSGLPGKQIAELKLAVAHIFLFAVLQNQTSDASGHALLSDDFVLRRGLSGSKMTAAERRTNLGSASIILVIMF